MPELREWRASCEQADVDWALLIRLARRHRMVPLLYAAVDGGGLETPGPALLEGLAAEARAHRARAAQQAQEVERLFVAFDARRIPMFVLKGLPLSHRLYGDPALRQSWDIDLLVRPEHRDAASAPLIDEGYQLRGTKALSPAQHWFLANFGTQVTYRHPVRDTNVEVHWFLHQRPDGPITPPARSGSAGGAAVRQLPPSLEVVDLLAHGAKHRWRRLKWLTDLLRAWECYDVDWAAWRDEVAAAGLEPALNGANALASWILPELPRPSALSECRSRRRRGAILARWARHEIRQPADAPISGRLPVLALAATTAVSLVSATPSFRRRRMRGGFLSLSDVAVVELPRRLYGLYPLLKPVWWSIRYTRRLVQRSTRIAASPADADYAQPHVDTEGNPRTYRLFGLRVRSDIDLPLEPTSREGEVDLSIRLARGLAGYQGSPEGLFSVPAAGSILVQDDATVLVEPARGANGADLRPFLLSSALGSICWRRGWIPMHATAIRFGDRAVLFAGPSGVGKSTLAAACIAFGGELVTDDIAPLCIGADGRPSVPGAGPRRLKLWPDAADGIGARLPRVGRVQPGLVKLEIGAARAVDGLIPIDAFIALDRSPPSRVERLHGADALRALAGNLYRAHLMPEEARARVLQSITRLASRLCTFRLARPEGLDAVSRLAERLAGGWPDTKEDVHDAFSQNCQVHTHGG